MKNYFYYIRDDKSAPVVTVCLSTLGGERARGVAVCSLKDQPCKNTGRTIASGRAAKALRTKEGRLPFSIYNPRLTEFEKHILRREGSKNAA